VWVENKLDHVVVDKMLDSEIERSLRDISAESDVRKGNHQAAIHSSAINKL